MDDVIRPANGLLLIALQSARGVAATLDPALHAVACEVDSVSFPGAYRKESSNETTGSKVAGISLVIGQPAPFNFRSRIRGAGAVYTASVKPPLHAAFQGCGMLGQFTAAIAPAALAAGTATSATMAAAFAAVAQSYRGMPLNITAGPGLGLFPTICDYTAGRVATLADTMASPLSVATTAGIPANWTYAGTSPRDAAARAVQEPYVTIGWYEDGVYRTWMDCRGVVDFDTKTGNPGFAAFQFTGTYLGKVDAAVPANAVMPGHSAPILVQPVGAPPALLVNRLGLPISNYSVSSGSTVTSVEDPNTPLGFGAGQIGGRERVLSADPLATLVATRNTESEIALGTNYPIVARYGTVAGNRWSMLLAQAQPVQADPAMRGEYRSESTQWQALTPGRDAQDRDGDLVLCFY